MTETEASGEGQQNANWVRGPRIADITDINPHKLDEAFRKRGVETEPVYSPDPKRRLALVTKRVVEGAPAPHKPLWRQFLDLITGKT